MKICQEYQNLFKSSQKYRGTVYEDSSNKNTAHLIGY